MQAVSRLQRSVFTKSIRKLAPPSIVNSHRSLFNTSIQPTRMATHNSNHSQPKLVSFYQHPNGGRDFKGRTLSSILQWPDEDLEYSHNYIQILFPLPEPSPVNFQAPVIDRATFDAFRSRPELRARLKESFIRILRFYGFELQETHGRPKVSPAANFVPASKNWVMKFNHNHMRITRIIRCLRVLGLEEEAEAFFAALEQLYRSVDGRIGARSLMFWRRAAKRPLYLAPEQEEYEGDGADFLREFEKKRQDSKDGADSDATRSNGDGESGNRPREVL